MYSGDEVYDGDITSGAYYSPDFDRQEMINALMETGEFDLELLQIMDDEELNDLCIEYAV